MTTQQVADRLYELCQQNDYPTIYKELFHPNAKSIEPPHAPAPQVVEGLENFKKKADAFNSTIEEVHSGYVHPPKVYGNYISMEMGMDVTFKGRGRSNIDELTIYKVEDGKIVSESFYY